MFVSISHIDPGSWVAEQTTFSISKALLLEMTTYFCSDLESLFSMLGFNLEVCPTHGLKRSPSSVLGGMGCSP